MSGADAVFGGSIPELYDRHLGPTLFQPYAEDLAARFKGFDGSLLETAAGTGRVTNALAAVVKPSALITATDLNEPMLARAQQLVAAPNVAWRQADAQALPFPDQGFDAVVCQFGVMFFPDKPAGYREARRVLRAGGRFVFNVWDRLEVNDLSLAVHELTAALFPDDPPAFLRRTPFGYHDQAEIRGALADAGFATVEIEVVARPTPARSAADVALGLCMGSPLRAEIEARRPGGVEEVARLVGEGMVGRFGEGPVTGQGQALVVTAA